MKKIFTLLVAAVYAMSMWAQRFQVDGLYYQVVHDGDNSELVLPSVAKPAAGQTTVVLYVPEDTPAGCYAVGSFNWDATNTEKMFTAVEGAQEGWVALTLDWTDGLEFKVLAVPSDEAVTPGWSYQWGKNVDPENDLEEDNVVILQGVGEFVLQNQGQPKLKGLADGDVCYIHVKAWATTPVIEAKPCETAAFKHPWGGGDWTYREATKTAEATFELNAIYGGNGVNVATNVNGDGENWYPTDQIEFVGDVTVGDFVNFKFISEKSTFVGRMIVTLIEGYPGNDEPDEAKDITVKAKVPATWTNTITAWVWPTGGDGKEVVPTKEGDWYVVTENCAELNIIFKNGEGWSGDANQTVDITGIKESTCLELASDGYTKATFTYVDCDNPWYAPSKKSSITPQKRSSEDSPRQVVVTYQHEWSSNNYHYLTDANIPATIEYRGQTYEVIGIREGAFAYSPITSVTIPNSIKRIGSDAFASCSRLRSVVWNAENYADFSSLFDAPFYNISYKITSFTFGDSVKHIPAYLCYDMENLTSITIPNSVTTIGESAFCYCSGLTSITIPNSVTSIGGWAFEGCSSLPVENNLRYADTYLVEAVDKTLSTYSIKEGTKWIGYSAFEFCSSLTSITIPNSVTSIGQYAFDGCSNLTSITIPESVETIGYGAFRYCRGLESVSIPSNATNPNGFVFESCTALQSIEAPASFFDVPSGDLAYQTRILSYVKVNGGELTDDAWIFINRSQNTLRTIDVQAVTNTELGDKAFMGCYMLDSLYLPAHLEKISYMSVADCKHLKSITIPFTVAEIGEGAFENCRLLSEVNFAEGGALTEIGNWAFYNCHELKNVVIPEGVTNVGYAAFYGCTYLKELTLPASMQSVADNGFALCEKLAKMNVNAVVPPVVEARTFENVDRMIPVVVPTESVSAYKAAPVWQEFNIQGKDNVESDLENIGSDNGYGVMGNGKIIRNGQLIIIRDGVEYNTLGQAL